MKPHSYKAMFSAHYQPFPHRLTGCYNILIRPLRRIVCIAVYIYNENKLQIGFKLIICRNIHNAAFLILFSGKCMV